MKKLSKAESVFHKDAKNQIDNMDLTSPEGSSGWRRNYPSNNPIHIPKRRKFKP